MEVAKRIGVSENSLYKWVRASKKASPANDKLAKMRLENQRLKAELRRVQEERGMLNKAAAATAGTTPSLSRSLIVETGMSEPENLYNGVRGESGCVRLHRNVL